MKSILFAASFAALSAAQTGFSSNSVNALGINCQGSSSCSLSSWNVPGVLGIMRGWVNGIDPNHWYQNGDHIVCDNDLGGQGICAFLQGTGGMPGSSIAGLLDALVQHGCTKCGSVPVYLPVNGDNNPNDHGILTVNYVSNPNGCDGLCSTGSKKEIKTNGTMSDFAKVAQDGQLHLVCSLAESSL
jgi:hypothetical protein